MRIALADAGDAMDDANFEESVANATIMRLTRELAFIDEVLAAAKADQLRSPTSDYFVDRQAPCFGACAGVLSRPCPVLHEDDASTRSCRHQQTTIMPLFEEPHFQ